MLDGLKDKSADTKKKIALFVAGLVSVLIFVVWLKLTIGETKTSLIESSETGFALWNKVEENMASAYGELSGKVDKIKEQVNFISEQKADIENQQTQTNQ